MQSPAVSMAARIGSWDPRPQAWCGSSLCWLSVLHPMVTRWSPHPLLPQALPTTASNASCTVGAGHSRVPRPVTASTKSLMARREAAPGSKEPSKIWRPGGERCRQRQGFAVAGAGPVTGHGSHARRKRWRGAVRQAQRVALRLLVVSCHPARPSRGLGQRWARCPRTLSNRPLSPSASTSSTPAVHMPMSRAKRMNCCRLMNMKFCESPQPQ